MDKAKPQPGGRTQDLRISGQTRLWFSLAQRLNGAKLQGGCAPTKRWLPDSYRTVTFSPSNVQWAGLQGLASARMTADLRNW